MLSQCNLTHCWRRCLPSSLPFSLQQGCASSSGRSANLHSYSAPSQEKLWIGTTRIGYEKVQNHYYGRATCAMYNQPGWQCRAVPYAINQLWCPMGSWQMQNGEHGGATNHAWLWSWRCKPAASSYRVKAWRDLGRTHATPRSSKLALGKKGQLRQLNGSWLNTVPTRVWRWQKKLNSYKTC